jgi:hypothetical protein
LFGLPAFFGFTLGFVHPIAFYTPRVTYIMHYFPVELSAAIMFDFDNWQSPGTIATEMQTTLLFPLAN